MGRPGPGATIRRANWGTARAWGDNSAGQLGNGTTRGSTRPVQVIGLRQVVSIAAGSAHSLAVKGDGTVWAWGANSSGQLGLGTTAKATSPRQVPGLDA